VHHTACHLGVAVDECIASESFFLYFSGANDTGTYRIATFSRCLLAHLLECKWCYFDHQVYTVIKKVVRIFYAPFACSATKVIVPD